MQTAISFFKKSAEQVARWQDLTGGEIFSGWRNPIDSVVCDALEMLRLVYSTCRLYRCYWIHFLS